MAGAEQRRALAGFGAEMLADATKGGAWYIGALVTPGIAQLLFAGREHEFIAGHLYPDITEFVRTHARPESLRGAVGLYRSMLSEGEEMRALAATSPLSMPVLAIGSFGGPFTASALQQLCNRSAKEISTAELAGVGHYVAQEAPHQLAESMLAFLGHLAAPVEATPV